MIFRLLNKIVERPQKKIVREMFFVTIEFNKLAEELIVGGDYSKILCERLYKNGHIYLLNTNKYSEAQVKSYHRRHIPVIDATISGIPLKYTDMPDTQVILGHIGYEG